MNANVKPGAVVATARGMTRASAMNEVREAIRRIPEGVLKEHDVIELVSGILGRHGPGDTRGVDLAKIDMMLKMAAADYVNTIAR